MDLKKRNFLEGKLPPPIGISDWETFSQTCYTVDKTLLIKALVDRKTHVALFTRPRRFGKTSALKMIRAFYEKSDTDTAYLFKDKQIWAAGERYQLLQGKNPVIYLTFKDHKAETWEQASQKMKLTVAGEVWRHREAVRASAADVMDARLLIRILDGEGASADIAEVLRILSDVLHHYHGAKPLILIDEYDMPISSASQWGYYDEMVNFMRMFLSGGFKDNKHLEMGVMTGVLRVAKEGILSGLNNLGVWSVFESEFSEFFGFTEEEVQKMADYYGVPEKLAEIKTWYDGYDFGGREIYNPWSVLNYFSRSCTPDLYWLNTSANDIIIQLIKCFPHNFAKTIEALLEGKDVRVPMAKEIGPYREVINRPDTLYSLLVATGYLKVLTPIDENGRCQVSLPNHEISKVFISEIQSKLNQHLLVQTDAIIDAFLD